MRYILPSAFLLAALAASAPTQSLESLKSAGAQSAGQLKETVAHIEEALKKYPDDIQLYIYLGMTYTKLDRADEAQQAFETAVRLDPKKAFAHYMLGLIYEKKSLRDKAIAAWKACLENASEPRMRDTARKHLHHLATR